MKFCRYCGTELLDEAVVCVKCGCATSDVRNMVSEEEVDDSVSAGLFFLAFLIPLFGIIYWPLKAKTRPKCALACGIAAIISWASAVIFITVSSIGFENFLQILLRR